MPDLCSFPIKQMFTPESSPIKQTPDLCSSPMSNCSFFGHFSSSKCQIFVHSPSQMFTPGSPSPQANTWSLFISHEQLCVLWSFPTGQMPDLLCSFPIKQVFAPGSSPIKQTPDLCSSPMQQLFGLLSLLIKQMYLCSLHTNTSTRNTPGGRRLGRRRHGSKS